MWPETDAAETTLLIPPLTGAAPAPPPGCVPAPGLPNGRHRRRRHRPSWASRPPRTKWLRWASLMMAALASALVAMLSVLSGLVSYQPLREAAALETSPALSAWWPLLIYGPWLVGTLSILRAALHQRHAWHSWAVVVLFSGFAVALCVVEAAPTPTELAVAGLPPVSALVAFHQIVRQLTLVHPPRHSVIPRQRSGRGT